MGQQVYNTRLLDIFTSFLSLLIFVSIDYFSIGLKLFSWDSTANAPSTAFLSSTVFIMTTYFAQIIYAFCSSFNTGITASIVFEAALISRQIAESCYKTLTSGSKSIVAADYYANILFCMFISTLIFAMLSFVPYIYRVGDHFKNLPLLAVFAVMASIGISILHDALGNYLESPFEKNNPIFIAISIISGLVLFFTEMALPNFAFLVPFAAMLIVIIFNAVFRYWYGMNTVDLQNLGYIIDFGDESGKNIWDVFSLFKGYRLSFQCVMNNIGNILTLVIFNLIHINVNVVPYAFFTKQNVDLNTEWWTQGLSNLLTACVGFPSYFVSSTSMLFYKSGAKTRTASCVGILVPAVLAFGVSYVREYIPLLLSAIILSYLGISFIYSYYLRIRAYISNVDFVIITMGVVFCRFVSFAAGFAIVAAISAITALRQYQNTLSSPRHSASVSAGVVKVDYVLCFMTIENFKKQLPVDATEITLDLTACPYIDMNVNFFLCDLAQMLGRMRIIGCPNNLYTAMLKKEPNVHISEVYY